MKLKEKVNIYKLAMDISSIQAKLRDIEEILCNLSLEGLSDVQVTKVETLAMESEKE